MWRSFGSCVGCISARPACGRRSETSRERSVLEALGESLQVERPAALGVDRAALALPALAVAVEVAVLEFDTCALRGLGDEANLHLARLLEVGLDLPLRGDVPAEHDPVRRLIGEHARPLALAAVDAAVVDAPTRASLKHRLRYLDSEHVVLARLDAVEVLREDRERTLDRCLDDDLLLYGRLLWLRGHETSSAGCSAAALKAARAWVQKPSSWARRAPTPSGSSW